MRTYINTKATQVMLTIEHYKTKGFVVVAMLSLIDTKKWFRMTTKMHFGVCGPRSTSEKGQWRLKSAN